MEKIIMDRIQCTETEAAIIAHDLDTISDPLKAAVNAWIEDETIDDSLQAEGYTLGDLMKNYSMEFTGAILTMDWLLKDPEEAKKALAYGIR